MKKTLPLILMLGALSFFACGDEDEHEHGHKPRPHVSEAPEPTASMLVFVGGFLLIAGTLDQRHKGIKKS
jgi:hypothetical protein